MMEEQIKGKLVKLFNSYIDTTMKLVDGADLDEELDDIYESINAIARLTKVVLSLEKDSCNCDSGHCCH